ncbi:MAG: YidC/Oxa1 family membrane protein insertase [Candidatus Woesearchaeota archaeon]
MQSCTQKQEQKAVNAGNFIISTTATTYSRVKIVNLKIENYTTETITIKNECPSEPFDVYKFENNQWVQKTTSPELDCSLATDIIINPDEVKQIPYTNWQHALFGEMGKFKIEFKTTIKSEEKTFSSNEFTITKEGMLSQLWRGILYRPIYNILIYFTKVIPGHDLGIAIILLTILVRSILLLPSQKAMVAQRKMQEIQPRLAKIKEQHKGDQQKIAMETMALWKEAKVNPFGSCLPLLMQIPFLIAVFYAIQGGLNPDNTYMLYTIYENFGLHTISTNFFGILELTKTNLYILPIIVGGLQFVQMKLAMARTSKKHDEKDKKDTDKKEKNEMDIANNMMIYMMPVMIAVFTASMPAGVGLYWGSSTVYGIIQQIFVNKGKSNKKDTEVKVKVIS